MAKLKFKLPHSSEEVITEFNEGEKVLDIIKREFTNYRDFLGIVEDSSLNSLNYVPKEGDYIALLDIKNSLGLRIYTTSLAFIFQAAIKSLFKSRSAIIEHYVGNAIYIVESNGKPFTMDELSQIELKMREIVKKDLKIEEEIWGRDEALGFYRSLKRDDNIKLLETTKIEEIRMWKMNTYIDRFEGVLVPSTSFINKFTISYYFPGALLRFPSSGKEYEIDTEEEEAKLAKAFQDHTNEAKIIGVNYVGELNEKILQGKSRDLILVSESFLDKKIRELASKIIEDPAKRLVLISGPSSSGKTTTAQKLKIALQMYGCKSVEISTDDYFIDRSKTPKNPDGTYDFETIDAVDIKALNHDIIKLIESGETSKRGFDFIEGKPIYFDEKLILPKGGLVILEGIHALNPILTNGIPKRNKLKIYLSALATMNIDSLNRLSTTDVRFIRRMVRDVRTRGRDVSTSLDEWMNVRRGENKYVFPFQEEADIMLNTSLFYEMAILKKHALKLLLDVPKTDKNYVRATRMIKMLNYFASIDDDSLIPNTSLLREFIGGSVFD